VVSYVLAFLRLFILAPFPLGAEGVPLAAKRVLKPPFAHWIADFQFSPCHG
jgi:hypothetical protein